MNINKIIKISSNQGGKFTSTNRLVDFDIPNDAVYDLSKSYVNLACTVDAIGADTAQGVGVYMPFLRIEDESKAVVNDVLPNVCLVKNCDISCANRGQIANIRRVDALRCNLKQYTQSTDEKVADDYKLFTTAYQDSGQVGSPFRNIYKEGSSQSESKPNDIQIPLSDLFGFGNITAYDARAYGKTRVHLELNLDKVRRSQYLGNLTGDNWARSDASNSFASLTAALGPGLSTLYWSGGGSNLLPYDLKQTPFWVGQKIRVSATKSAGRAGADLVNVVRRITAINWRRGVGLTAGNANLELTLNAPIEASGDLTGDETYTNVVCDGDAATFTFNCDQAELVLEQVGAPPATPDKLSYTEFSTEEHTANGVTSFQRMFELEPECINVYIMKTDGPLSKAANVDSWRLRNNNVDLTNRAIRTHEPFALDRTIMTLENSGQVLKNTNERARETFLVRPSTLAQYTQTDEQIFLICNPVPMTQQPKQLQVNIDLTTANGEAGTLNRLCVYKELIKSI